MARLRMAHATSHPIHLLCADDHTLVGEALAKVFSTAGYRVERADDGESAWQKLSQNIARFQVVITDHVMPRLDGLGLVARLRGANYPGRIIVYTETISADEDLAYRKLAVDAIVAKGPDSAKLLAVVEAFHAGGS